MATEAQQPDHHDTHNGPSPSESVTTPTQQSASYTRPHAASPPPLNTDRRATPSPALTPTTAADRVFPIRSVVSVNPTLTPNRFPNDYFHAYTQANDARAHPDSRRQSTSSTASHKPQDHSDTSKKDPTIPDRGRSSLQRRKNELKPQPAVRTAAQLFSDIISNRSGDTISAGADGTAQSSQSPSSKTEQTACTSEPSIGSNTSTKGDPSLVTHRFQHVITAGGHAVITGRGGETLQRCEDEPIHIPGAIQGFGLLIALREESDEALVVRIVSENSKRIIGRSPQELFALESFADILSEEQADNLLDHIDFIKDEDADVATNGPEVFTMSVKIPGEKKSRKLWCAIHLSDRNPGLIICEFELEDDPLFPAVPPEEEQSPELPEDTLHSQPTEAEFMESTENISKPLRVLRSARKRRGEAAAMEVFNIMSQVQEQLAAASSLERFLKVLVGVVKELTGFHRVMIYQFDSAFNGRVVTELVDPRATKDLYQGLKFPATDIPKQARDLYQLNRVRMLYDRDQETARLVCRTAQDIEHPLDLSYSYLRAMSPIHLKYLANMAVRSSMSISINAFNELWGLISCHTYGTRGVRVSFPIRKMCRLVGDAASRNIERLSYASRLQARKLINTAPTQGSPSGYIVASSDDLLKLFNADFGLLSIHGETKILGRLEQASQEALAMLEYLRLKNITSVLTSQDVTLDFPDLHYPPGFQIIAGMLIVPLSAGGRDFIVFFRRGQLKEVKWAGNPYEKFIREGTEGYLEPRASFKVWRETVVGKSREWTEEEVDTAAVLCLVYGKFIDVWRQKEAALQNSQLTRLLLANSAHEVRTPLNAIINYLEIALEGQLDQETRDNLTKSHSASKSLIYVINDLLDLTKTEEGGSLIKGETFNLQDTLKEATDMFSGDAKRKNLTYEVIEHPGLPQQCIGDHGRVRQAISNITANAIKSTTEGGVKVEMYVVSRPSPEHVEVEVAVTDTGSGMSTEKLDQLFNELEQAQTEQLSLFEDNIDPQVRSPTGRKTEQKGALGLGLAIVSRIIRNMNGQLRLKSEEGKGSRFVILFPFELPDSDMENMDSVEASEGSLTPVPQPGERTLVARSPSRHESIGSVRSVGNRGSTESLNSRTSQSNSLHSANSGASHRSDVDRLIEAIQIPHRLEDTSKDRVWSPRSLRPTLTARRSSGPRPASPTPVRSKSLTMDGRVHVPPHKRSAESITPGQEELPFSSTPLKPVKMPDEADVNVIPEPMTGIVGEIEDDTKEQSQDAVEAEPLSAEHMRVLVAEDDPVNSRIIKKRLEKLGHSVTLTVNGEECAGTFNDKPQDFDVILMDMQMPIVDGLTSTKLIRSFEKTKHSILSPRAAVCGRIPIIAVSASLVERCLQEYVDTGFDAWILKPISFYRLGELMTAIVDRKVRKECLYRPGDWERGGWFHCEGKGPEAASTAPTGRDPRPENRGDGKENTEPANLGTNPN